MVQPYFAQKCQVCWTPSRIGYALEREGLSLGHWGVFLWSYLQKKLNCLFELIAYIDYKTNGTNRTTEGLTETRNSVYKFC